MNYYNPYTMMSPMLGATRTGLFGALKGGGLTLGTIINGTQKTLGIVNQAIPLIKQVTPVMKNAKTMFRVMNEFKKVDTPSTSKKNTVSNTNATTTGETEDASQTNYSNGPTFFV